MATRFRRSFSWFREILNPISVGGPPTISTDVLNPTMDAFGTNRYSEVRAVQVNGGFNIPEIFHTRVPQNRIRFYLSTEYWTNSPTVINLRLGRIITQSVGGPGFPFMGLRDEHQNVDVNQRFAFRNMLVPPLGWMALQASGTLNGNLFMRVVWIEMPLGEYIHNVAT